MNDMDKILLKLHYKAREQAIEQLLIDYSSDDKIVNELLKLRKSDMHTKNLKH